MNSSLIATIAQELRLRVDQVAGAVELLDAGNTIPFIARYRKEATGGLDEVQLRLVEARLGYLRNLHERKQAVLASIDEQGKLTEELRAGIEAAATLQQVEDLYLPYRPKRRTRATIARERLPQRRGDDRRGGAGRRARHRGRAGQRGRHRARDSPPVHE